MAVRTEGGGGKGPLLGHNDVAAALSASAAYFALAHAYQEELEQTIYPLRAADPAKPRLANQRLLASLNTLPVLQFVWKESPFVTQGALGIAGVARLAQGGPLTTHGLTMLLHSGPGGAGAAVKRVARIVRAGQAYGLIETHRLREKMVEIAGTRGLHELMLRVRTGQALKLPLPPAGDAREDDAA